MVGARRTAGNTLTGCCTSFVSLGNPLGGARNQPCQMAPTKLKQVRIVEPPWYSHDYTLSIENLSEPAPITTKKTPLGSDDVAERFWQRVGEQIEIQEDWGELSRIFASRFGMSLIPNLSTNYLTSTIPTQERHPESRYANGIQSLEQRARVAATKASHVWAEVYLGLNPSSSESLVVSAVQRWRMKFSPQERESL